VAFMDRFAEATALQRSVYFAALLSTALATAFFIAPTIQHRILASGGESYEAEDRQWPFNSGYGSACDRDELRNLFGCRRRVRRIGAIMATTTMVGVSVGLWYLFPLYRRMRN
jgi:hypothetical protein